MVARSELRIELRDRRRTHGLARLSWVRRTNVAAWCGLAGAVVMGIPILLYDWVSTGHSALEALMAPTAWLFGLDHFAQNGYQWWPIAIGAVLFVGYAYLSGMIFSGAADRIFRLRTLSEALVGGIAYGFISWLFVWYTLLPIARDGAPFRTTASSTLFVAPNWVFIIGFAGLGLATSVAYWIRRRI